MSTKQKTIKQQVSLSGVGLHTGEKATVTFKPADENHGYVFRRVDLDQKPTIKADCDLVVDTSRGTTLEQNGARVHTTEHLLAAAYGLEIDNLMIEIDGPEVPILDGSSAPFIDRFDDPFLSPQWWQPDAGEYISNLSAPEHQTFLRMIHPINSRNLAFSSFT